MAKTKRFRVSYYFLDEVVDGRAPVRTSFTTASSAEEAKKQVDSWPGISGRVILKAYPYYKTFKQPTRKTWIVISGPQSPATKSVMKDLSGMTAHDKHEQIMETFKLKGSNTTVQSEPLPFDPFADDYQRPEGPCAFHPRAPQDPTGRCLALDNPCYCFPNRPVAPTQDAEFVCDPAFGTHIREAHAVLKDVGFYPWVKRNWFPIVAGLCGLALLLLVRAKSH